MRSAAAARSGEGGCVCRGAASPGTSCCTVPPHFCFLKRWGVFLLTHLFFFICYEAQTWVKFKVEAVGGNRWSTDIQEEGKWLRQRAAGKWPWGESRRTGLHRQVSGFGSVSVHSSPLCVDWKHTTAPTSEALLMCKSCRFHFYACTKAQSSCFCSLLLLFNKLPLDIYIYIKKKQINCFFNLATVEQKCNLLAKRAVPETNGALAYSANSSGGFQPVLTVKKKRLWLIQHDSLSVSCCETEPRKAANRPSF